MKLHLLVFPLLLALIFSFTGCGSFKPAPEGRGRGVLKAPQTGSNIRRLEKQPSRQSVKAKRLSAKKKRAEAKAKRKKPAGGVADESYVPRGGFR